MLRPVSEKASRDAWIMLICSIDWDNTTFKKKAGTQSSLKDSSKRLSKSSCGHGYAPEESARITEAGQKYFMPYSSCMGGSPRERQTYYQHQSKRNRP